MKKNIFVSVSADPIREYHKVLDYAKDLQGITDMLHCDVMDGVFVPDKNFDDGLVYNINQNCLTMLDVHLMCNEPLKIIDAYLKAGANIVTVHYEAFEDKDDIILALNKIKSADALAGIAIKPETNVKQIKLFLHDFDIVNVLSVEPGASGQKFIPETMEKIKQLNEERIKNNYHYKIEIDGGVNCDNAQELISNGCDILVSGNYVYKAQNRAEAISKLKNPTK